MIRYTLELSPDNLLSFLVDESSWSCANKAATEPLPPWVRLDVHRCAHCSLADGDDAACPSALSIRPVIEAFGRNLSYEKVLVRVETEGKVLHHQTTLQDAIRSLLGLLMALSACPVMMKLRPMARFHLPFGNPEHTLFRVLGMYLLAQHLREQSGLDPDRNLDGLAELYRKIHVVNLRMADRLRIAADADAAVNGVIILDLFAQGVESNVQGKLPDWRPLFAAYLDEGSR